nr:hypothetical protein [Planctomycetota bacterium]
MRDPATRYPATLVLALLGALAWGEGTDNHLLIATPPPGPVAIDGDLADWDRSRAITVCPDVATLLGSYSALVMAMWDDEALYLACDWRDPTPMVNDYAPDLDLDRRKCFHSDSLQVHVRTDLERTFIAWHHRRTKRDAVISLDGWSPWGGQPIVYHDAIAEYGVREAFTRAADGEGYTQELRIPWTALSSSGRAYRAGESLEAMLDLVWGPASGQG